MINITARLSTLTTWSCIGTCIGARLTQPVTYCDGNSDKERWSDIAAYRSIKKTNKTAMAATCFS